MKGIFELRTPADLRKKLIAELERFRKDRADPYVAFNLFVTGEHLLDWVYPGSANRAKRSAARSDSVILRICSHIANGAKHFEVEDTRHESVSDTGATGGYFPKGYFPAGYMPKNYFPAPRLIVRLDGDAKQCFGEVVSVEILAQHLVDYWNAHPEIR